MPPSDVSSIDDRLAGLQPEPLTVGMSAATVARWGSTILKTAPPTWDRGLDAEAARLEWLATTPAAPIVPRVVAFERAPHEERLLTAALPGTDLAALAARPGADAGALAHRFGRHLRDLHDRLDPGTCPFDARLDVRLAAARRRVVEGDVDESDFDPEQAGRTAEDVLDELERTRPPDEDLVVGHGDWCYPNVVADGTRWGMCDLADLGVCCRWYDLGIGARSTLRNLGAAAVPEFFAGYGVAPDPPRVAYYRLLDELQ